MLLVVVECDRFCCESMDILGDRFVTEIGGDRCLMLLVVWAIALTKKWYDKLYEFGFINENS
jgi:hypothetical protein